MSATSAAASGFRRWEAVDRCPACGMAGSGRTIAFFPAQSRCCACRHVYLSPRPTQDAITEAYGRPDAYAQWLVDEEGRRVMWEKRIRRVERFATGGQALDVGAGTGAFLHGLSQTGRWQVEGTEISGHAVELASQRYGIELRHGALAEVDLPSDHFDLVTLWHVLEHVPDVRSTLETVVRIVKPGGVVVIAVPNDSIPVRAPIVWLRDALRRTDRSGLRLMMGAPVLGEEIHLQHFSSRSLARIVRRAGLKVRHLGVDDHYPLPQWKTDLKVRVGATLQKLTRVNFSPTILLVAEAVAGRHE